MKQILHTSIQVVRDAYLKSQVAHVVLLRALLAA